MIKQLLSGQQLRASLIIDKKPNIGQEMGSISRLMVSVGALFPGGDPSTRLGLSAWRVHTLIALSAVKEVIANQASVLN